MRTCLVSMPWHVLSRPCLATGVLRGACAAAGLELPAEYHGSLRFADFLLDRSGGALTPHEYVEIVDGGFPHQLGDWIFGGTLYGPEFGVEQMREYAVRQRLSLRTAAMMREHAEEFVGLVVDEVLALDPELVGFSSTFMQNVPSLSVARRLKQRRPGLTVLFGGANCDGPMGAALHREFGFVDLVLSGECDDTFPLLVRALDDGSDLDTVPGLYWRDSDGRDRLSPRPPRQVAPARIAAPDFDDWFKAFEASAVGEYIEPELAVESARGCWWGEHHHCTFCGLNGTTMTFRAKQPEAFVAELSDLVAKHSVLDVLVVDNILEPTYLRTALPELARRDWDLRVHYEVKANLTPEQVRVLEAAGVCSVQPGIETLVDDVLARMNKGVRAVHNVRTMRDCESAGLTVSWNWLYGFPGESEDDYRAVLAQLPALVHLQPPIGATRIELNRFSPYFDDPALGFAVRTPSEAYSYVYDIPVERLYDLVYLFDTPAKGITDEQVEPLADAIALWIEGYPHSSLRRLETDDGTVIRDRRAGWPAADFVLESPAERAAWLELEHGRSVQGLRRRLADAGHDWDEPAVTSWLGQLLDRGLVFTEGDRWIALATSNLDDSRRTSADAGGGLRVGLPA